jgi:sugar phosphate permease
MIDRLGSRMTISGCGVLTAIGGLLFSQADTLGTAMAARILIGVGTASVLMATFTIFSHWFSKQEFGRVSGFMVAVGNLGNLAATAPLALSVGAFGWRASFLAIGVLQVLVTILVFSMVQDRPTHAGPDPDVQTAATDSDTEPRSILANWGEIFGNRDFWMLGSMAFFWYGNYLALQALWGGPYLMEVLHLSRKATGTMLMFTSLGFIVGSMLIDTLARQVFGSYKKTLLTGQLLLLLLMSAFLGWAETLPHAILAGLFFSIGLVVSSGVLIYPIIRSMFPVRIVGTALTSLNFYVLMGAAVTQQVMGVVLGASGDGAMQAAAFHQAFLFPVAGLLLAIGLYACAKDYGQQC